MRVKRVIFLALLSGALWALELDVEYLKKELQKRPDDTKTALLLAKYYIETNQSAEARKYIDRVLAKEPENSFALQLSKRLKRLETHRGLIQKYGSFKEAVKQLYQNKEYDKLLEISQTFQNDLDDESRILIAKAALEKKRYDTALRLIQNVRDKNLTAYHEVAGVACQLKGDTECAGRHFETLLQSGKGAAFIEPLLEIYAKEGSTQRFKELLLKLKQVDPSNPNIPRYEKMLKELEQRLDKAEYERFMKEPTYERLENLVFRYYRKDPYTIFDLFRHYFAHHPHDQKALSLFGRIATWRGDINLPDDLLTKVAHSNNYEAKLLVGKALSWKGEYERALPFLLEVLQKGNATQRYEAKKAIAFIYKWQNRDEQAKKLFEELYAQNPKDLEVKEALDVLRGDVRRWIDYYEAALQSEPNNSDYILRLAQYYRLIGDLDRSIKAYERYLKLRPDDLQIHRFLGDLYLAKKDYYKGFSHLEYYAEASTDPKAFLELAKRYYWHGYHKEALDVLEEFLKTDPKNAEARRLRAKILQAAPRFLHSSSGGSRAAAAAPAEVKVDIDGYFRTKASKILANADKLYFGGHPKGALPYFQDYLRLVPDDRAARERYAFALEQAGSYAQAAAEFYLLLQQKEDDPIWRYHYAYNLAKTGKKEEAKKILTKLRDSLPKPLPPFLQEFLRQWEDAWEHLDFERYVQFYDPKAFGKKWRRKKQRLFKRNGFVELVIKDPLLLRQDGDTYVVRFYQIYRSKLRGDRGYKTLVIRCKEGKCKIIKEQWEPASYNRLSQIKELAPLVDELLKELSLPEPKKISLPKGTKRFLEEPKKILNIAQYSIAKKKEYFSAEYRQSNPWRVYPYQMGASGALFSDNQNIFMKEGSVSLGKRVHKGIWVMGEARSYTIKDDTNKSSGQEYRLGLAGKNFHIYPIFDRSGSKDRYGYDLQIERAPYTLRLFRRNAVYTKRTWCAKELMQNTLSLSRNSRLFGRDLWARVDLSKIEDDYEKTLMFDYQFIDKERQNYTFQTSLNGWYQFHSQKTPCYYSPSKTDATLLTFKWIKPLGRGIRLETKAGGGYTFWEDSFLYDIGFSLSHPDIIPAMFGFECDFSNSSPTGTLKDYRSIECGIRVRKFL